MRIPLQSSSSKIASKVEIQPQGEIVNRSWTEVILSKRVMTVPPQQSVATESITKWNLLYQGSARTDPSKNAWYIGEVREKESLRRQASMLYLYDFIFNLLQEWCWLMSDWFEQIWRYSWVMIMFLKLTKFRFQQGQMTYRGHRHMIWPMVLYFQDVKCRLYYGTWYQCRKQNFDFRLGSNMSFAAKTSAISAVTTGFTSMFASPKRRNLGTSLLTAWKRWYR